VAAATLHAQDGPGWGGTAAVGKPPRLVLAGMALTSSAAVERSRLMTPRRGKRQIWTLSSRAQYRERSKADDRREREPLHLTIAA